MNLNLTLILNRSSNHIRNLIFKGILIQLGFLILLENLILVLNFYNSSPTRIRSLWPRVLFLCQFDFRILFGAILNSLGYIPLQLGV